jgi:hypothetical protein
MFLSNNLIRTTMANSARTKSLLHLVNESPRPIQIEAERSLPTNYKDTSCNADRVPSPTVAARLIELPVHQQEVRDPAAKTEDLDSVDSAVGLDSQAVLVVLMKIEAPVVVATAIVDRVEETDRVVVATAIAETADRVVVATAIADQADRVVVVTAIADQADRVVVATAIAETADRVEVVTAIADQVARVEVAQAIADQADRVVVAQAIADQADRVEVAQAIADQADRVEVVTAIAETVAQAQVTEPE